VVLRCARVDARKWLRRGAVGLLSVAALLGVSVAVVAWSDGPLPVGPEPAGLPEGLPPVKPPPGLSLTVFETARASAAPEAMLVGRGRWLRWRKLTHIAVLIVHPEGQLLYDTGLGREIDDQFSVNGFWHRRMFGYARERAVVDQLVQHGWAVDDVRLIVPSHLHWDHASGLPDFPDAVVWATPEERRAAAGGSPPAFLRSQFDGVRRWRDLLFEDGPYLGYPASQDVFRDGSVVLVPLTGHTPGQVGLFLTLPSGRRYFFIGDVTWTLEGVRRPADRSWLLRRMVDLDHDEEANQRSIVHVHHLARRYPQLTVVPAHDEAVLDLLPRFPEVER
jgi:glyoxylase-like metal-dependent hydrolase (beta-lactamase superfamily II)